MAFYDRLKSGLAKSRERINESINVLFEIGPSVDLEFWDDLEETLILADMGAVASVEIVEYLKEFSTRKAILHAQDIKEALADQIAQRFVPLDVDPLSTRPTCVLFVGINGAGKTTTVGKLAKCGVDEGRSLLIGSGDTFRAAAIEQLHVWADRAGVPIVEKQRGSDPASVCHDVMTRALAEHTDLVLIDTAGRLHTSPELMRELAKVVKVTKKCAQDLMNVFVVLVMDATTGQNGLAQAREFHKALGLDGVILTKLDGTAKGGIAVAIAQDLQLPILRIGVGEQIEDLRPFNAHEFASALVGTALS